MPEQPKTYDRCEGCGKSLSQHFRLLRLCEGCYVKRMVAPPGLEASRDPLQGGSEWGER